ncbi:superoxide dismutase (fe) [Heliomicrobium modesticaldum Ice1]|uniref:superoxide dismutase n=1 Tax=Heliobacterium modesticaldum (strain ATCC 51547 / Ice1) TaxID=498761 RepID=B0TFT6_HELMI|nr:superoxide dismutase (fe) [Heliomicrobium modesticaldum Ice1]
MSYLMIPPGGHQLPPLPYPYNALEPVIGAETLKLHHDRHHLSYVEGLNKAERKLVEARQQNDFSLIKHWERELAFHGSGHILHSLYWAIMALPGRGRQPGPHTRGQVTAYFGNLRSFQEQFSAAAATTSMPGGSWSIGSRWRRACCWPCRVNCRSSRVVTVKGPTKDQRLKQESPQDRGLLVISLVMGCSGRSPGPSAEALCHCNSAGTSVSSIEKPQPPQWTHSWGWCTHISNGSISGAGKILTTACVISSASLSHSHAPSFLVRHFVNVLIFFYYRMALQYFQVFSQKWHAPFSKNTVSFPIKGRFAE